MSLKHAILGFLSFKSLSGYDLKKAFDRSIQHFWPANQSQIYRTLSALSDDGQVDIEVIEREDRLDMKIYHITESGEEELHQWLSTPLPEQAFREPFLIQLYFGSRLSDEELFALLDHAIQELKEKLEIYQAIYTGYKAKMESIEAEQKKAFFMSVITLEYGLMSGESELAWMESVTERLKTGKLELTDFGQE